MNKKALIRRDIRRCDEAIENKDTFEMINLLKEFRITYSIYYKGLEFESLDRQPEENLALTDLIGFKGMLEILQKTPSESLSNMTMPQKDSSIKIENKIINEFNLSLEIMFKEVINEIKENPSISSIEADDILKKIQELQNIANSKEIKVTKWNKVKPIINWVSTKGVDIALKIMPLIIESIKS